MTIENNNDMNFISRAKNEINSSDEEKIDIKEVINIKLLQLMFDLENKISNGRIRDKETEKIKLDYYKTLLSTIDTYTKLSKDINTKYAKEKVLELLNNMERS